MLTFFWVHGPVRPRYTAVNRFQLYLRRQHRFQPHNTIDATKKKLKARILFHHEKSCNNLTLQPIASNRSFVYVNLKCLRYNNFTGIFNSYPTHQKKRSKFLSFCHCWFYKFNRLGNDCLDSATVSCVRCSTLSTVHRLCICKQLAASWVLQEVRSALLHEMKG